MTEKELKSLLSEGEGISLEFKSSFNTEVIECIVAFSNAKGGIVIVGVNDNKAITGVTVSDESIRNWLNQIKQNTIPQVIPDVQILELNNKCIVVLEVIEYPIKPVAYRNKYYKRIANSNHLMRLDEITYEHLKTINNSWDFYPDSSHGNEKISLEKVERFVDIIEKRTETKITLSPVEFLEK